MERREALCAHTPPAWATGDREATSLQCPSVPQAVFPAGSLPVAGRKCHGPVWFLLALKHTQPLSDSVLFSLVGVCFQMHRHPSTCKP